MILLQSSNGRHRSNSKSIHRHLAFSTSVLHGVLQKIAAEFRKDGELVSFFGEDIQLEIYEMLFDAFGLCNLSRGAKTRVCVLKFLQELLVFHSTVGRRTAGRQTCFQLKPVSVEFIIPNRFENVII